MASDRNDSLYESVHSSIKKHLHKHMARHIHGIHKHRNRIHKINYQINHIFLHTWELIVVWIACLFGIMHAWNSWSLPNNSSFWYPLQKVSTVECRTQYWEDMDDSCKINLPIIKWANYSAYKSNSIYRSIYTTLRWASYSSSWDQMNWAHAWLDIATARWTPLYSIWNGIVYSAWWNSSYGNLVRIKYVYNWEVVYWVYAHMDTIEVSAWQSVTRWQKVWTVWNSGNTTWALWWYHVHFEIDKDNSWRPAYSYTNCSDLSLWHYKIIQNGLCRDELFEYQYDPIRIIEWVWMNWLSPHQQEEPQIDPEEILDELIKSEDKILENTEENNDSGNHNASNIQDEKNESNNKKQEEYKWIDSKVEDNKTTWNEKQEPKIEEKTETKDVEQKSDTWTNQWQEKTNEDLKEIENQKTGTVQDINQNSATETKQDNNTDTKSNTETKYNDPEIIELSFDKLTWMPQHFMTQRDIEIKSKMNTRSLKLWETLTIDLEVFKKWTIANRVYYSEWILQTPFQFIANNDNISVNISSLQLLTKWKASIEVTWIKEWNGAIIIKLWWDKIWVLNVNIK